jgi:hypothetical protein
MMHATATAPARGVSAVARVGGGSSVVTRASSGTNNETTACRGGRITSRPSRPSRSGGVITHAAQAEAPTDDAAADAKSKSHDVDVVVIGAGIGGKL